MRYQCSRQARGESCLLLNGRGDGDFRRVRDLVGIELGGEDPHPAPLFAFSSCGWGEMSDSEGDSGRSRFRLDLASLLGKGLRRFACRKERSSRLDLRGWSWWRTTTISDLRGA